MPRPVTALIPGQDLPQPVVISFGAGKHSRVRSLDVDMNECVDGQNFDLDLDVLAFRRRKPFDLVATAPNAGSINGFAQYIPDSTAAPSTIIQAAGVVYSWDGTSTGFTAVGTCSANARLRGKREANFNLLNHVLVTDLNLIENVKTWDGTTYADLAHNLTGTLQAKFCHVHQERAIFANVVSNGTATPHVILASAIDDDTNLSAGNRPSSSIGSDAAWFLPVSDLRSINGLEHGFGQLIFSTSAGSLHRLTGSSSFDYAVEDFYDRSNVSGDEAMCNIGNDILMGLPGRIETLSGTINFGDVETDDLSAWIKPDLLQVSDWRIFYNQRTQRIFCFPNNLTQCLVISKTLLNRAAGRYNQYEKKPLTEPGLSPWSPWKTDHAIGFQPVTVWSMIDPNDLLEYVFMGDQFGNIYRLEGSGSTDGSTALAAGSSITASRTSGIFRVPQAEMYDVKGWISYAKAFACDVTLTFQFGGVNQFDQSIVVHLPDDTTVPVYGGSYYYSSPIYYSATFGSRLTRQFWQAAGQSSHLQCKVEISGDVDFSIAEVGFTFTAVNQQSGQKR